MKNFKIKPNTKIIIIEDYIDASVQLEYLDYSEKYLKDFDEEKLIKDVDLLFSNELSLEEKKILLVRLSKIDDISIYRKIEKYYRNPDEKLRLWSIIAFQESHNLIQSSLLEENSVLVSSALGGKESKMRFFIVIQNSIKEMFTDIQKKIITQETKFVFEKNNSDIEKIEFGNYFFTIIALFPFSFDKLNTFIENILDETIEELKLYQIKIADKYLITNTKIKTIEQTSKLLADIEEQSKSKKLEDELNSYVPNKQTDEILPQNSDDEDFFYGGDDFDEEDDNEEDDD